jgi:hypothetical protein
MVSGHTGNVVPGNRLRVRIPCPPLDLRRRARVAVVENVATLLPLAGGAFDC